MSKIIASAAVEPAPLAEVVGQLIGREVEVSVVGNLQPYAEACRGLIADDDKLVGVIGADLAFAHRAGAALAMVPPGAVEEQGDEPNELWLEYYGEVANVLTRVLNDAGSARVRIDPGVAHDPSQLLALAGKLPGRTFSVTIPGYGVGAVGVWTSG